MTSSLNTVADVICGCGRAFTKRGLAIHKCELKPEAFICEFCKKDFTTENYLVNHLCEPKRRYLQKDDKSVKLGFMAYDQFNRKSMGKKISPTYEQFAKSSLYGAFVRFGRHLKNLNALNPIGFVDFLLKIEAKIDKWTSPTLYDTYVRELTKNELALDALERNFMLMQQWSMESNEQWQDFFRKVQPPLAILWISCGRISPWILFTASSAHLLFSRFTPEQAKIVESVIDPEFWRLKLEKHKEEVETIRAVLAENGI